VCRSFDPSDKQQALNSAQEWANVQNAESQKTPMQTALQNAGKAFNAHNAQIEAQKADPNATPESVTAGAVRHMLSNLPKIILACMLMYPSLRVRSYFCR
jgi:hypothetical protein